jgi:hypothetical protein
MPHCVVRIYHDSGPLISAVREHESEVREIMTGTPGFVSWAIIDTGAGALSITVCKDKAGTDDSIARAAAWIKKNLPDAKIDPPQILEGEQVVRFAGEGFDATTRPHLVVRIFDEPAPAGLMERMDEVRALLTAVSGFRAYSVIRTANGGISVTAAQDKEASEAVSQAMREFVMAINPDRRAPQVIEGEGVFRFAAQTVPA